MGRLIDADDLINYIPEIWDDKSIANIILKAAVIEIINSRPTAYDVNKVVEQLEDLIGEFQKQQAVYTREKEYGCAGVSSGGIIGVDKAIGIVKKGGIE